MAITYSDYTGDGSNTDFAFSFPYLEDTHVVVEVDGVDKTTTAGDFTLPTTSLARMTVAPADGALVRVKRVSDFATDLVDFTNGSVLTEGDLDRAYQHNRYLNEEAAEGNDASMQIVGGGTDYNAANKKIVNLATPTASLDAANKNYVDDHIALSSSNLNAFDKSTHTGDNTETEFTLSFTSQTDTDEAYLVTIDGVVQTPTTAYSVDSTTNKITFTSAPPTSASIVVVPLGTSPSANDAEVTAAGSTTARTLAARASDVVNVKDYGATGDGSTDDSTSINAAIAASKTTSGKLYFPDGVYVIKSTVTFTGQRQDVEMSSNAMLKWEGSTTGPAVRIGDGSTLTQNNNYYNFQVWDYADPGGVATTDLMKLDKASRNQFYSLYLRGNEETSGGAALNIGGVSIINTFFKLKITFTYKGILFPVGGSQAVATLFFDAMIEETVHSGIHFEGNTTHTKFFGGVLESITGPACLFDVPPGGFMMDGTYFEANETHIHQNNVGAAEMISLNSCHLVAPLSGVSIINRSNGKIIVRESEHNGGALIRLINPSGSLSAENNFSSDLSDEVFVYDTATTGGITSGTPNLVLDTAFDRAGLVVGDTITIAGVTGTKTITAISADDSRIITIDSNADATVSAAAVSLTSTDGDNWVSSQLNGPGDMLFKTGNARQLKVNDHFVPIILTGVETGVSTGGSRTVTFAQAFPGSPTVSVWHYSSSSRSAPVSVTAVTSTGFTAHNWADASTTISWMAVYTP